MYEDSDGDFFVIGQSRDGDRYNYLTVKYTELNLTNPKPDNYLTKRECFVKNLGQLIYTTNQSAEDLKYYNIHTYPAEYYGDTKIIFHATAISQNQDSSTLSQIELEFLESNTTCKVRSYEIADSYSNYFLGHTGGRGLCRISNYKKLIYNELFTNIDFEIVAASTDSKYYFIVQPGGFPQDILLRFNYHTTMSVDANNNLLVNNAQFQKIFPSPVAYQLSSSGAEIPMTWAPEYLINGDKVEFIHGIYNLNLPLIYEIDFENSNLISSAVGNLDTCINIGYNSNDRALNIKLSEEWGYDDEVWEFIAGVGPDHLTLPYQTAFVLSEVNYDVYIQKDKLIGEELEWVTWVGGSGADGLYELLDEGAILTSAAASKEKMGFDVDPNMAVIAFGTKSLDIQAVNPMPNTSIPYKKAYIDSTNTCTSLCIASFNPWDGACLWKSYFGDFNTCYNNASSCALQLFNREVYLAGYVHGAPTKGSQFTSVLNPGNQTSFVAKFNQFYHQKWTTYLQSPNSLWTEIYGIDVDSNAIYLTGYVDAESFPVVNPDTSNSAICYYSEPFGGVDAFITKISNNTDTSQSGQHEILWATYFGGDSTDVGYSIKKDSYGTIYLTGYTASTDFITTQDGNGIHRGGKDIFISKFTENGELSYSTLYGGSGDDIARDIGFYKNLSFFVGSSTSNAGSQSGEIPFPFPNLDGGFNDSIISGQGYLDDQDGLIFCLNDSSNLVWATFFGGEDNPNLFKEMCTSISICNLPECKMIYLCGYTCANDFFPVFNNVDYMEEDSYLACFDLELFDIMGIQEYYFSHESISIFPNPSSSFLYSEEISYNDIYYIYDITKKLVDSNTYKTCINIAKLKKGIYVLEIVKNDNIYSAKFIKFYNDETDFYTYNSPH